MEKVIVHEADKSSGVREQRVDVHLNFIGQFMVPEGGEQPGDAVADAKRAVWREYKRKARIKQQQEKEIQTA